MTNEHKSITKLVFSGNARRRTEKSINTGGGRRDVEDELPHARIPGTDPGEVAPSLAPLHQV